MLRSRINSLIIVLLATIVFFMGAGVTIMNYCCSDCRSESFFMSEDICCSLHHLSIDKQSDSCCISYEESSHVSCCQLNDLVGKDHCSAIRLSVDIDSSISRPLIMSPIVWISENLFISQSFLSLENNCASVCEHMSIPPAIPPRNYLSIIRVLII